MSELASEPSAQREPASEPSAQHEPASEPSAQRALHRLSAADFADHVPGLAGLFVDAVAGGASLGFVAPFDHAAAEKWWRAQEGAVADGERVVWVSCGCATNESPTTRGCDRVDGTVSVTFDRMPNARHRGTVGKLMVHRSARGGGLGRALLATAERAAAAEGATLLLLDTESGSVAERLYRSAGWTCYGVVPAYAADTTGTTLRPCSFFYKELPVTRRTASGSAAGP